VKPWVPLWCKSNFSFLQGASHPDELMEQAASLGLRSLGMTDVDGVYGMVRAHKAARQHGVHLIAGAQITVEHTDRLLLWATSRTGWANLCRMISIGRLQHPKGTCNLRWDELLPHTSDLIACYGTARIPDLHNDPPHALCHWQNLRDTFGDRLYLGLSRHLNPADLRHQLQLHDLSRASGVPIVAVPEILYHTPARRPLQDILTCIRHNTPITRIGTRTRPNASHSLAAHDAMMQLHRDCLDTLMRTVDIAERCTFRMDEIRYRYPEESLPDGATCGDYLRDLTMNGAARRYPNGIPADVLQQLNNELTLINTLDYGGYFLTMYDIVRWCASQGILCQGRGSAANSAVCYCLGITAIDPVRMGLLFERFLSLERAEPPDIDLDIGHERREEVIQYVYQRYGRTHAAMVANVIRYRPRSAVRDVGKALGMSSTSMDRVSKLLSHYSHIEPSSLQQAGLDPDTPTHRHLLRLANELLDFPRHLSIHPGGFLLGHEPIDTLVPVENATMADRTVIQWDKDDVETLGLFKVDLLGLGALTHIDACLKMIRHHGGPELTLRTIPAEDPDTYAMIQRAETVGVFQIESRAQMQMLPRLRPQTFYDLVIEVSIVRPGPITGDMVHPYLRRRRGEEPVVYPHPILIPVLEKTLGVPLFQEQVMKLAVLAADYTPGEADQLRRDMGAWRSEGRMEQHRSRIVQRMVEKGIAMEFAERVFNQIRGFGEYGFPESHAASFALISYATAWLRCHHPAAFAATLLNSQPMGFYAPATVIEDARRRGVEILPVDIHRSQWACTLEPATDSRVDRWAIRLGASPIRSLTAAQWQQLDQARQQQPFRSIDDVRDRTRLPASTMESLARAGVFHSLTADRRSALWLAGLQPEPPDSAWLNVQSPTAPILDPLSPADTMQWDYQTMSRSAQGHPLAPLRARLKAQRLPDARTVASMKDGRRVDYAGLVICRQRPGTASGVVFMTLEDETGFVNLVLWPNVFDEFSVIARTVPFLGASGQVQAREGVVHLIVHRLWAPQLDSSPEPIRSRDFH
jgi:error-prone DNA polymerase